ncbi:RRM domain-containing protein [Mycena venus]|uniref:RRM domain-containing protein n=1 Tax=Mycena venus TaxID=2733690 RepID=A0A8H6YUF9_9AGAR|nr:RRM domain-containing protein [Mycena venus]
MTYSVHVSGIAPTTTEAHLNDFFTFCGKIDSIDYKQSTATIHFEKSSAAKTAQMLNGGTLDGAQLVVTSETEHEDEKHVGDEPVHSIDQSDKPRAGIAAEYLARGYTLSDHVLNRAIEIDNKNGISKRFLSYLTHVDKAVGEKALGPEKTVSGKVTETATAAAQQVRAVDEQRGISRTATDYFHQYYSKALSSQWGEKVRAFYTTTSKQVLDIHEEAKRISAEQKAAAGTGTTPAPAPAPAAV